MPASLALVCHVVLVGVFAWALLAKLVRFETWRAALARYRLGFAVERAAAFGVPAAEGAVAVLLVWGDVRIGAALALALLSAFSLAVLRARATSGNRIPCGCFGAASTRDYREMLGRNAVLAAAAAGVLLAGRARVSWTAPEGAEVLAAALSAAGVALAAWVLRQAGPSLRRRA